MEQAIIGFCGPIGSGKDEAATVAEEFGFRKVGFADHLKEVCKFITGHDYTLRETKDSEVFPRSYWTESFRGNRNRSHENS